MGEPETEDFARLMRELKERAGLSYGMLARRLHTSTSTLHRYCKGEAVPADFAVVDRFARACGAAREEAVDLHRAWLLADARRRAASRGTAEASPAAEPGAPADPGPGPEAGAGQGGPGGPGPWYRRRAVGVSAAGVVAVAVAVAVLAAAGPETRTPRAGPAGSPGPATGSPARSAAPAPGTAGPSGPTASAVPPDTAAPATPATPSAGPSGGSGAPSPAASAGSVTTPLAAAVRSHVWAAGCDHAYLSERAPGSVPAPPVEADAPAWARAQRAVHAGTQIVEVTLHGTGEGAVVLQGLEVRVTARRTPPAWNVYRMSQGCGGGLTPAGFAVNLDAPRPLARPVAGNDSGVRVPAPALPLRVSASEPAVLRVQADATGCDCDWSLDLRWSGPGGSGTLRLDDDGVPWRTSATAGRPEYGFASELGRWAR
ncbi:transcriptional regulator [Streptomyces sp. NBC_00091]|uniref:transcriptional regulator n=1 Tax=Streptomyces sp. NBC_00091 TaxID=2975648 RepID=UPI002253ADF3|nr:transcriptional regulator [Streptomyces sp. NBC_00091]MCX5378980.1 helix-turn-helix domain-containing protein [Streptomyces sp. NBC_00091]